MEDVIYAVNLYFDGLSLRKTSKALSRFVNRSHTTIRDWVEKYKPQRLLSGLVKIHGKHPVSTDDGGTWYPQACRFLNLDHHIHSSYEKSMIERTIQYIKDRTESFDDYFPCKVKNCKLKHVRNWLSLFVEYHDKELIPVN